MSRLTACDQARRDRMRPRAVAQNLSTPLMIRSPETSIPPTITKPEDHELQRGGKAHHAHHLVEPGQEERGGQGRDRAGQTAGQRSAADDHGGDGTQQVGAPTVTPGALRNPANRTPAVA